MIGGEGPIVVLMDIANVVRIGSERTVLLRIYNSKSWAQKLAQLPDTEEGGEESVAIIQKMLAEHLPFHLERTTVDCSSHRFRTETSSWEGILPGSMPAAIADSECPTASR